MSVHPRAVFLSYAREDAATARRIAEALRGAGLEVWFDENELRGGDAWDAKIKKQIRDCALFMPIVSRHTQERREGYFRLEWHLAEDRSRLIAKGTPFLVPVAIDGTDERDALVPEVFLSVQWTRLPGGQPSAEFCARARNLLGGESMEAGRPRPALRDEVLEAGEQGSDAGDQRPDAGSQTPEAGGRRAVETRKGDSRSVVPWMVAGLALMAVGLGAYFALRPSPPAPAVAKAPANKAAKSIAVLPFANMGADKSDDYLSDGLTDELLNALCKVKGLRVPGRGSTFAFRGKTGENIFREVGEKLHVNWVLEGSLRKAGAKVRIIARETGSALRSRKYGGLILRTDHFENETHNSAIPLTLTRGIRWLYGDLAPR